MLENTTGQPRPTAMCFLNKSTPNIDKKTRQSSTKSIGPSGGIHGSVKQNKSQTPKQPEKDEETNKSNECVNEINPQQGETVKTSTEATTSALAKKGAAAGTVIAPHKWPCSSILAHSYVLTIREKRYKSFIKAVGKTWSVQIEKVQGINGADLSLRSLYARNKLAHNYHMKRGRIGCYLSHVSIWEDFLRQKYQTALILEDDVDIQYGKEHSAKLQRVLHMLMNDLEPDSWDLAYLCHRPRGIQHSAIKGAPKPDRIRQLRGEFFENTYDWHELYGYVIRPSGAKALVELAFPIRSAVDVYIGRLAKYGKIKTIRLALPICKTRNHGSDTEGIM